MSGSGVDGHAGSTAVRAGGKTERTRARIIAAASGLFATEGFDAVTTQRVSQAAGIAAGTLFRYASTKGELLLMVLNDRFAEAIDEGVQDASSAPDAAGALWALARPVLDFAGAQGENTAHYQIALLYGPSGEPYRDLGRELVAVWRDAAAARLSALLGRPRDDRQVAAAAEAAFAVLSLAVADRTQSRRRDDLREQLGLIAAGLAAASRDGKTDDTTDRKRTHTTT